MKNTNEVLEKYDIWDFDKQISPFSNWIFASSVGISGFLTNIILSLEINNICLKVTCIIILTINYVNLFYSGWIIHLLHKFTGQNAINYNRLKDKVNKYSHKTIEESEVKTSINNYYKHKSELITITKKINNHKYLFFSSIIISSLFLIVLIALK